MNKKIIYILPIFFFFVSCGTFDSAKRALTGAKKSSADEFLIKKKDPLILPPDYESLPTPDERISATEEVSNIEKELEKSMEETEQSSSSTEESILKKIQQK